MHFAIKFQAVNRRQKASKSLEYALKSVHQKNDWKVSQTLKIIQWNLLFGNHSTILNVKRHISNVFVFIFFLLMPSTSTYLSPHNSVIWNLTSGVIIINYLLFVHHFTKHYHSISKINANINNIIKFLQNPKKKKIISIIIYANTTPEQNKNQLSYTLKSRIQII